MTPDPTAGSGAATPAAVTPRPAYAEVHARGAGRTARDVLARGARAWGIEPRAMGALWLAPVVIVAGAVVAALLGKAAYLTYVGEDGVVETLQVVCYVAALAYAVRVTRRLARARADRWIVGLYACLCLGLVFMVGEEISWGQRLFGWGTPELLADNNKQAETNLHNIYGVGATFKWLQMVAAGFGVVLPLLVSAGWRPLAGRTWARRFVPHWTLVPFFLPLFVWRLYRNLLPDPPGSLDLVVTEFNEVVELIFALGILLFVVWQWRDRAAAPPAAAAEGAA